MTTKRTPFIISAILTASMIAVTACGASASSSAESTSAAVEATTEEAAASGTTIENADGTITYQGDGWSIVYNPDKFFLFEGRQAKDPVQLSYQKGEAGSDFISVEKTEFTSNQDCIDALDTYTFETITESTFDGYPSLTATTGNVSSEASDLTTNETFISVDKDGQIYLIEVFETVEPNEEDAYRVGGDMENTLDSIQFN